jgi:hypothetical protein
MGDYEKLASDAWQELIEKDDRTSPPEYPNMALVTLPELRWFLRDAIATITRDLAEQREWHKHFASLAGEWEANTKEAEADRDAAIARAEAAEHALELLADLHDAAGMPNCAARKKARSILAARITAATQTDAGGEDGSQTKVG